jgi:hypothetical protein
MLPGAFRWIGFGCICDACQGVLAVFAGDNVPAVCAEQFDRSMTTVYVVDGHTN